jgi:hypothetical protein
LLLLLLLFSENYVLKNKKKSEKIFVLKSFKNIGGGQTRAFFIQKLKGGILV